MSHKLNESFSEQLYENFRQALSNGDTELADACIRKAEFEGFGSVASQMKDEMVEKRKEDAEYLETEKHY